MRIRFCYTAYVAYWPKADVRISPLDACLVEKSGRVLTVCRSQSGAISLRPELMGTIGIVFRGNSVTSLPGGKCKKPTNMPPCYLRKGLAVGIPFELSQAVRTTLVSDGVVAAFRAELGDP